MDENIKNMYVYILKYNCEAVVMRRYDYMLYDIEDRFISILCLLGDRNEND